MTDAIDRMLVDKIIKFKRIRLGTGPDIKEYGNFRRHISPYNLNCRIIEFDVVNGNYIGERWQSLRQNIKRFVWQDGLFFGESSNAPGNCLENYSWTVNTSLDETTFTQKQMKKKDSNF